MAKTSRKTGTRKSSAKAPEGEVSEPQAPYIAKPAKRAKSTTLKQKGYDARRYTGMIPGIAERMKEYVKHMRDER